MHIKYTIKCKPKYHKTNLMEWFNLKSWISGNFGKKLGMLKKMCPKSNSGQTYTNINIFGVRFSSSHQSMGYITLELAMD